MNSKSLPFKKRENPFGQAEPVATPASTPAQTVSPAKTAAKVEDASTREKYTATMERSLRKKVKLASVEKGIMFSQYIEDAVMEKLEREGY